MDRTDKSSLPSDRVSGKAITDTPLELCIDESGDHSMKVIDPQFPVFVLGGVVFDTAKEGERVGELIRDIKWRHIGREDINMHTSDIVRCRAGFEFMKDTARRSEFLGALNNLLAGAPATGLACALRKDRHAALYGTIAMDPYRLCLEVLIGEFGILLEERGCHGSLLLESRGALLDRRLMSEIAVIMESGTRHFRPSRLRRLIRGVRFADKSARHPGLELADLLVTPVARESLGKPRKPDWHAVERLLAKNLKGSHEGRGLVILPRQ